MSNQLSLLSSNETQEKRIVYFDLETMRSAQEVGGWNHIDKMGMSCGVLYDSKDNQFTTYWEKDVPKLIEHLKRADLVVGFNHVYFDYQVLSGYDSSVDFHRLSNFDILLDIKERLGRRLKLDSLAKATLKTQKSADGLQALEWFKEGKMDQIAEYCQMDVQVTRDLFIFGMENNCVYYPDREQKAKLNVDWDLENIIR